MSNQCVLFFTDEALAHVINKQSYKDKPLMSFVRKMDSICLQHNIVLKAKHIPGIYNNLADSRCDGYRRSDAWLQLTWIKAPQRFSCICSLRTGSHSLNPYHVRPSMVTTYVSALGYSHKLSGFPDPSRAFFIMQMLKGYSRLGARLDSRLPITLFMFKVSNLSISSHVLDCLLCLS